jgi:hypothetical protein
VLAAFGTLAASHAAFAVEGGSGAYLLGSRDLMAGFVPPPGTYVSMDAIYINGSAPALSIGGLVVTEPEIDAMVFKLNGTHVFDGSVLGGRFGLTVMVPVARADIEAQTDVNPLDKTINVTDEQFGLADITITPSLGWSSGHLHSSFGISFYLPAGQYSTAEVKPLQGEYDILSTGKNKFAVDPTLSLTYLNPENGFELSGALGVTISAKNEATDYLTAPELHLEMTAAQHFPAGFVLGATGYAYQQLGNDSGSGAESFQNALDAKSLQARVFGAGPVLQYNTKIGELPVSLEGKFIQEFGAKRRLESQIFWLTAGAAF